MSRGLKIELPEEILDLWDIGELEASLKRWIVLEMVKQRKISVSLGAKLLGTSPQDFIELMSQHHIPLSEYGDGEIEEEYRELRSSYRRGIR
ncbi:UPF0175 family protein [Candidatus Poribacteria bacterium]|nr:UPF0175 family protein [Candidatus Poribacteria bacterium]